jgi:hypothetical protein
MEPPCLPGNHAQPISRGRLPKSEKFGVTNELARCHNGESKRPNEPSRPITREYRRKKSPDFTSQSSNGCQRRCSEKFRTSRCRRGRANAKGRSRIGGLIPLPGGDFADLRVTTAWLNAMLGARFDLRGKVTAVSLVIEGDRITRIYATRNSEKLTRLDSEAELRR